MTVPIGWTSKGVARVRLPLPDPDQAWPLPCRVVVDPACLMVDPNSAVALHMNALVHELNKIAGIEIVDKSWRANLAHSQQAGKVLIVSCLVKRKMRMINDKGILSLVPEIIGWKE